MKNFEKIIKKLTMGATFIGQIALFCAMAIVVSNIIIRLPFRPIPGTVELTEIFGAVLLATGAAYCALDDDHISVDILVNKLSSKKRAIVEGIVSFISFIFLAALAGQIFMNATRMLETGAKTSHLGIPNYPLGFLITFGFLMLAAVVFLHFVKKVLVIIKGSEKQWTD